MEKKKLVIFDMDQTLVLAHTPYLWFEYLETKGILTEADHAKHTRFVEDYFKKQFDPIEAFRFELHIINRVPATERDTWYREFFHQYVKQQVSEKGLKLIKEYKASPNTVVILVTASLLQIASHVAEYAQMHDVIATEGEMIDGKFTGNLLGMPTLGEGKVHKLGYWLKEKKIIPEHLTFYSDSINDLPLLSLSHRPIAVDPDKELEKIALENQWEIVSFK